MKTRLLRNKRVSPYVHAGMVSCDVATCLVRIIARILLKHARAQRHAQHLALTLTPMFCPSVLSSSVTAFIFPGDVHVVVHHDPSMPTDVLHAFYQTLDLTRLQTGRLEVCYFLLGYVAPPVATLTIADQFERFRQDSLLRHVCLQAGKGLQCGVASPFLATFQRAQFKATLPRDTTVFGNPDKYCVVQS